MAGLANFIQLIVYNKLFRKKTNFEIFYSYNDELTKYIKKKEIYVINLKKYRYVLMLTHYANNLIFVSFMDNIHAWSSPLNDIYYKKYIFYLYSLILHINKRV